MKPIIEFFAKFNTVSKIIARFLVIFYFAAGVFMFTQGEMLKGISCLVLALFFFYCIIFISLTKEAGQLKEKILALINLIGKSVTLENNDIGKTKIKLVLFQLDSELFRNYGMVSTGIFWKNINNRPDSDLIKNTIEYYFSIPDREKYKLNITDAQGDFVKEISKLYNSDLIYIYSILNHNQYLKNTENNKRIVFK